MFDSGNDDFEIERRAEKNAGKRLILLRDAAP